VHAAIQQTTRRWGEPFALAAIVGAYLLVKVWYLCVTLGDQNLYFYASRLWAEGAMPYRDFFLSHPPAHLFVSTLVILAAGTNLRVLLALPSVFGLLSGLLVYTIARRALGVMGAILASVLFLFSLRHLLASSYFTGVNVATFWLLLAVCLSMRGRALLAGLALGLGVSTAVYTAVGACVLLTLVALEDRRKAIILGAALGLTAGVVNLTFLAVAGQPFLDQVYGYHLAKSADSLFFPSKMDILRSVLSDSWPIALLAACDAPAALAELIRPSARRGAAETTTRRFVLRLAFAMLLGHALFLFLLQRIFTHYFLLLLPFAVLLAADLLVRLSRWRPASVRLRHGYPAVVWLLIAVVVTATTVTSLERFRQERGLRCFVGTGEVASYVDATLQDGETIFGDFGIVPLLALVSHQRVAATEIESSIMRFESGTSSLEEVLGAIDRDNATLVIARRDNGIIVYPPFQRYLLAHYVPARRFTQQHPWLTIDVWRHK